MTEYRRRPDSDAWHWCRSCSNRTPNWNRSIGIGGIGRKVEFEASYPPKVILIRSGRPIDLREGPHVRHRAIVVDHEDNIWTGYMEKYNADGRLLMSISRMADWFMPHTETRSPWDANSDPPNPELRELTVGSEGRLWAAVWVADLSWKEGLPTVFDPRGRNDTDKVHDTVLEAIDPANGKVIARTRSKVRAKEVTNCGA